jgi:hypothetical protein
MDEKKPLNHSDYLIEGTEILNFTKWSRENIPKPDHKIPVGTLVEVKFDSWFGEGACWKVHARLWVVLHGRDCDGTPLYTLSRWRDPDFALQIKDTHGGFSEESLTPVKVTDRLRDGYGALAWDEDTDD